MARKFYLEVENSLNVNDIITVSGDEFNHIVNVMRSKVNDKLTMIDGKGFDYNCSIVEINKRDLKLKVEDIKKCESEAKVNITVFQALVKGDKFELIIQKLTELGINKFVPFMSEFCQVKPNTTRLDRLEKISIEALKQCGRAKKVQIENILSFNEALESLKSYDKVIYAYEKAGMPLSKQDLCDSDNMPLKNIAIVIGSEGGFSESENEELLKLENVKQTTMGKRILRAETAAISLTSVVMYLVDEWKI